MKSARTSWMLGLATFAVIASPFAMADDSGWYGGFNIGQSRAKIDKARISSGLSEGGFTTTSITDDGRDTGYKLFGGYQLSKNFSLEGGYFDLGKFGFTVSTLPPGTLTGNSHLRGLNLDALGVLPVSRRFSAFGRVGLNYAEARDTFSGNGSVNVLNPNPSKRGMNPKVGLGLHYAFTEAFGIRFEAERYRINGATGNQGDTDLVSAGLVYRFGVKPADHSLIPFPDQ